MICLEYGCQEEALIKTFKNEEPKELERDKKYNDLIQTNNRSGNSGGPLFNSQGQVVGITTFTPGVRNGDNNREAVNMGFAVTSKTIKNIIQQYPEVIGDVF